MESVGNIIKIDLFFNLMTKLARTIPLIVKRTQESHL